MTFTMNHWHTSLASQGAIISQDGLESFGNAQAELAATATGGILADLSYLSLLQISGDDALTFLQGQVTNDVKLLNGSNSQYAGYCTPKGRLLALFLAYRHAGDFFLQVDASVAEAIAKRLRMYVLRSKVQITDVSEMTVRMGVAGKNVPTVLNALFPQIPLQPLDFATSSHGILLRLPGDHPRYEIIAHADGAHHLWTQLKQQLKPVGKPCWEWLEIQAGIPDIVPATQEEFVPQMVNLDALGAINYKKGCYTGQEIVARTHYLGKVKRRMQPAHITGEARPQPGDDVFVDGSNEAVGKIVRSSPSPVGGYDVLAEVRLESLDTGLLTCGGSPLLLSPLPYSLD
jgi:folate-binding protein YgfZ